MKTRELYQILKERYRQCDSQNHLGPIVQEECKIDSPEGIIKSSRDYCNYCYRIIDYQSTWPPWLASVNFLEGLNKLKEEISNSTNSQ